MPEVLRASQLRDRNVPVTIIPGARDALHEALHCLDTADEALRRGKVERTDEVLALLQAAASHLETAWDISSTRDVVPPHMRGAE
jgi:hypothetical protein